MNETPLFKESGAPTHSDDVPRRDTLLGRFGGREPRLLAAEVLPLGSDFEDGSQFPASNNSSRNAEPAF